MKQFFTLFPLFKQILLDKRVIGTAIVIFLAIDFAIFVANYKPKPPKKKKKTIAPPPPENTEEESGAEEE